MQKRLGMRELESQVLEVLWAAGRRLTPGEVHETLPGQRQLAYTTVMTVLVRLWKKQLVDRTRVGRAYAYFPRLGRGDYAAQKMKEILTASGNSSEALASFIHEIEPRDLARLKELLLKEEK